MKPPRALLFDVFGTLVDWHGGIAREVDRELGALGLAVDASAFAQSWRAQYQPAMQAVRSGRQPYTDLDRLHRDNLDKVLTDRGLADQVDEATRERLVQAWHRLDAWPDVSPALAALRPRWRLAPCSNGHIALMVDLARHNGLVWDAVLGADIARTYKPQPAVYLASCAALGCAAGEVVMVAAHSSDLAVAAAVGLRTAFIARPDEHGPGLGETCATVPVDWSASDLQDLARQLGSDVRA